MSAGLDLVVRGGLIVTPGGVRRADLAVAGGRIARIAPEIGEASASVVDASGWVVFPGIIDAHVHFNEPGRADWEGLETGSAALAAGGGACFFDMPLNSEPPVLDAARLREKRSLAEAKSHLDFGIWGGLVPGTLDRLEELRDAGAIGLKAFLCNSGIASFPAVDAGSLKAGMARAASLGMLVGVHAEDDALAARFTDLQRGLGRTDARGFLDSRPVEVELEGIRTALDLAGETGCALHIVHVSCPEGLSLIAAAKARGVNVTAETCPHYLLLSDGDVGRIGAAAKCAPPLRDEARRAALWDRLRAGEIDTIGSDHSPAPPGMKMGADFFAIWGGIAGCQHGFELVFSETAAAGDRELPPTLAAVLARNVARRFRIGASKGELAEGMDADFSFLEFGPEREIAASELLTRHRLSPYIGRRSRVRITHTFLRGEAVWADGKIVGKPRGRYLRPET